MAKWNAKSLLAVMADNERETAKLYREIAASAKKGDLFFEKLAQDEERHENIYEALAKRYAEEHPEDVDTELDEELTRNFDLMVQNNGLKEAKAYIKDAKKIFDKDDIYDIAIGVEKEAVLFASELRDLYPDLAPKEVGIIIKEEKKHLAMVTQRKLDNALGGRGL